MSLENVRNVVDEYHDRTFTKAFVRNGNTIKTIFYYPLHRHIFVKDGENDMTIVEACTTQSRMSSADKIRFIKKDPDLEKHGNTWTCGGCKRTKYRSFTRYHTLRDWLTHKVRCPVIQKKLRQEFKESINAAPPDFNISIGTKKRKIALEENISGVIRNVFDNGDCVAIEAERAAAKTNKLYDQPLLANDNEYAWRKKSPLIKSTAEDFSLKW